jgi:DNA-binding NarL/FixJ family response regulator
LDFWGWVLADPQVIQFSMRWVDGFVAYALQTGARGFLVKYATGSELITAIQTVMAGKTYLSPLLNQRGIQRLLKRWTSGELPGERLTSREHAVLQLSADGMTSSQIGDYLQISPRTVEMHRGNLMRKLGLSSQTALVRFAIRKQIISA